MIQHWKSIVTALGVVVYINQVSIDVCPAIGHFEVGLVKGLRVRPLDRNGCLLCVPTGKVQYSADMSSASSNDCP